MPRHVVHQVSLAALLLLAGCAEDSSEPSPPSPAVASEQASARAQNDSSSATETPIANANQARACAPAFVASVVSVSYGPQSGYGQDKLPGVVLGPPHGEGDAQGSLDVLSLGRGGEIVIDFGADLVDGEGADLIVFENAFLVGGDPHEVYHELAEVAVSLDGVQWSSFPCSTEAYPFHGCAGWRPVHSHPDNTVSPSDPTAAGGDPFDLRDAGVERARYVRIRDVSGSGSGTTAGFDLDAAVARYVDCNDPS